ncbi:MAG: sigma-70 family RNA polymerase sigma factor, partial [Deltaproteobacteria bacterium]
LAEDLVQDTWVSVLDHIASFEGRASLASWIYAILLNKTRSRTVREARMQSLDANPAEPDQDSFDAKGHWAVPPALWDDLTPERIVAGRRILDIVNAAIDELPEQQKTVLLLRGAHGLSGDEVCALLAISSANLRVSLHRARLAVRAALDRALE